MTAALIVIGWFAGWMVSWPALLAYFQRKYPMLAERDFRENLAFAMGISLIPVSWFLVPFMTGFYEYGFMFKRDKQ